MNNSNEYNNGFVNTIGSTINAVLSKFQKIKKSTVADYCPINGVVNDYTIFLDNLNLVTLFEIKGATYLVGDTERKRIIEDLQEIFITLLREQNCAIQIVYQKDKKLIKEKLVELYQPMIGKAKALKLDAQRIISERIDTVVPQLSGTEIYIAV